LIDWLGKMEGALPSANVGF